MKTKETKLLIATCISFIIFILYTIIIKIVDVAPIGPNNSSVGLASINDTIHKYFGVNMLWYEISDYFVKAAIVLALVYTLGGIIRELIKHKNIKKITNNYIWLFVFYLLVISLYILFEKVVINYRPIIMDEGLEASYPSSHTLVMLCITIPLMAQCYKKISNKILLWFLEIIAVVSMLITITGRLISGVHWFTDILGSILLSIAMCMLYFYVDTKLNKNLK